jgi:hypothetical protein
LHHVVAIGIRVSGRTPRALQRRTFDDTLRNTRQYDGRGNTQGQLPVGTRMPSLRQVITQHRVSRSTVFPGYYLLEEWGVIHA